MNSRRINERTPSVMEGNKLEQLGQLEKEYPYIFRFVKDHCLRCDKKCPIPSLELGLCLLDKISKGVKHGG